MELLISAIIFIVTVLAIFVGFYLRTRLDESYFSEDSKKSFNLGVGLVATMTALILGLITAESQSSFRTYGGILDKNASQILTVDRLLASYGEDAREIRLQLKGVVGEYLKQNHENEASLADSYFSSELEQAVDNIRRLVPKTEYQNYLHAELLKASENLLATRLMVIAGIGKSVPKAFIAILFFWLTFIFFCFGLEANSNKLVIGILVFSALSVSSAIFLILELDTSHGGILVIRKDAYEFIYNYLNR